MEVLHEMWTSSSMGEEAVEFRRQKEEICSIKSNFEVQWDGSAGKVLVAQAQRFAVQILNTHVKAGHGSEYLQTTTREVKTCCQEATSSFPDLK